MNIGMRNLLLFNIVVTLIVVIITFIVFEKATSILTTDPARITKLSQGITECVDMGELRKKANLLLELFVQSEAGKKEILRASFLYFGSIFVLVFLFPNLYLIRKASQP